MKKQTYLISLFTIAFLFLVLPGCRKEWLEAKSDRSLSIPITIQDFQALLNNVSLFNVNQSCGLGEIGAGDFYVTNAAWLIILNHQEKSSYVWAPTPNFYNNEVSLDWNVGYKRILGANTILHGIEKITPSVSEQQEWNTVKGSALFFRSFDFFNMAQEYCVAYDPRSANDDLGLPLRLDYDVNIKPKRSTLKETYDRIIADLETAASLIGTKPQFKTQPSKEAVHALLARIYLVMENYERAGYYANLALQIQSDLMDYSKLNSNASFPIARFNVEVIFHSTFSYSIFNANRLTVTPELLNEYTNEDYRKAVFFTPNAYGMTFKGSYNTDKNFFGGLATDEMYLIRAESKVRNADLAGALGDLNALRKTRWKGIYTELVSADQQAVLEYVLKERRRQLVFRGIRWTDLRRLNKDGRFAVTLSRTVNGKTYTLPPNDKRYIFPIDEEEILLGGTQQNDRD